MPLGCVEKKRLGPFFFIFLTSESGQCEERGVLLFYCLDKYILPIFIPQHTADDRSGPIGRVRYIELSKGCDATGQQLGYSFSFLQKIRDV